MKNNIKKIIAAVVVLLLLVGVYLFVSKLPSEDEKSRNNGENSNLQTDDALTQQDVSENYLIYEKAADVESVVFNNGEITYTIHNGETPSIEGYTSHIIDNTALLMAVYSATSVYSNGVVEGADDLSKYGLDKEDKYMIVKLKNGEERKVIVGNPTYVDGEYYATLHDSGEIHRISANTASAILASPDNYRSMNIAEIVNNTVSEFSVSAGGERVIEIKYINTKTESSYLHVYNMLYPYENVEANQDTINLFCQTLSSVSASEIVEENPADLSKYGLDKPYSLYVKDSNGSSVIKMGNYADDGTVYVMKGDVPVVYKAVCSFYESVKNINPEDYVSRFIHLYNIKDVSGITVKNAEKTYDMEIIKKSEDKYEYKLNGKIKVKETFSPIYTEIIGLSASSFETSGTYGAEKCSITFRFTDKSTKTFVYYEYDERYYCVKADNGLMCLVTKDSVEKVFAALAK